jgi:hypothetical protein
MSDLNASAAREWRAEREAGERLQGNTRRPNSRVRGEFEHFEQIEQREKTDSDGWPEPDLRLVEDDRSPAPKLDDDALPAGWERWIGKEAEARGCPRDYIAAGLIVAASGWIGNSRHASVNESWCEPPHLWLAEIGAPSTGKTPGLKPFIEASRTIERDAEPAWQTALAKHASLTEAAKAIEEQWCADVRTAIKAGQPTPDRPHGSDAPSEPPRPRLLAMDATTEELQHLLAGQPRGLLYVRDELTGWFGNHDRYGGSGGDRAFFLEAWNGGAYVADRVKHRGQPVRITHSSLSIIGGMQPDRLREALAGADDGLAARLAYIWPDPPPISRLVNEPDGDMRHRRHMLIATAQRLHGLLMEADSTGELAPILLRLDQRALALFDELRQEAMQRARSSRGLASGWHGKTPGRALRLALAFKLLAWSVVGGSEPRMITGDAMARAGAYLDYLAAMFDRVTAGLAIRRDEADAAAIARNILSTRTTVLNERELYQLPGWSWLRDSERRANALRVLADAGWIRQAPRTGSRRRRGDWRISPSLRKSQS